MNLARSVLSFVVAIFGLMGHAEAQRLTPAQVVNDPELVHARLRATNPEYRDQGQFELDPYVGLVGDFTGGGLTDLSPLQGIPFRALDFKGLPISDLAPLKEMSLVVLGVEETGVTDLHALAGMRLSKLYLNGTAVADLSPLTKMPITELMLVESHVKDLRPLQGMPLQGLWLSNTPVLDIAPLAQCPLVSLTLEGTDVADLRPLSKMSTLQDLHIGGTKVSDLTPIKGLRLKRLIFTPENITMGLDVVRAMKTLEELGTSVGAQMSPKKFWQLYDQRKIR